MSDPDSYYYVSDYFDQNITLVTHHRQLFYAVCLIIIFCISVPGNSFFLRALLRERSWKTTPEVWLLHLIISDLCLTMNLPFRAYDMLRDWILGDVTCKVVNGAYFLGLNSYVLILTAITLSNYVAVVHASCLSAQASQKCHVLLGSIVMWSVCVSASIAVSVYSEAIDSEFGDKRCCYVLRSHTMEHIYYTMQIGLFFFVPFVIITFCSVHMWVTTKLHKRGRRPQTSRLSFGIIVVFFICMIPYSITLFIEYLMMAGVMNRTYEWNWAMNKCEFIIYLLPDLHCCLNPLILIFALRRFRQHLPSCNASPQRRGEEHNLSSMAGGPPHERLPLHGPQASV